MNVRIFLLGLVFIAMSYFFMDFITPIAADIGGFWRVDDILATTFGAIGGGLVFAGATTTSTFERRRR
jgi:hypothetical protein